MNKVTFIMYHYVRDLNYSRYRNIKGLDVRKFVKQLNYLKKNYNIISMEEVISSLDTNDTLPSKAAVLTFDDAYIDHYINVFPILDQMRIKGAFYTPIKAVTEYKVLDVNKIHFILAAADNYTDILHDIKEQLAKHKKEYALNDYDYYYKKLAIADRMDSADIIFIKHILQVELPEIVRNKIVSELFEKYVSVEESVFARELYMNKDQIMQMSRNGMHIGLHGYNHYWWNKLNNSKLKKEIELSIEFMQEIGVDIKNLTACYPYGAYNDRIIKMLKEKGCRLAFTTEVGTAELSDETLLKLPRYDTNDMWDYKSKFG